MQQIQKGPKIKILSSSIASQQPANTYTTNISFTPLSTQITQTTPYQQTYNYTPTLVQPQTSPTKVSSKIKIKQQYTVDHSKSQTFESLIGEVKSEIEQAECQYNISPVTQNDVAIYQFWSFEFAGKGNFEGKCISGVLQFHQNHPIEPPKFFFDLVKTKDNTLEVIQHLNIYGDNSLCIPLFTYWTKTTKEFEILQTIENIFHNPNIGDSANPTFAAKSQEERDQIQKRQAMCLRNFVLER
ncbi:unnamed protein product [Paramecium sonneborni]|uniref:UBC core domain-containing protein n=1 Tax=Paramecium sonneborni TaxID=65129 RepID=A0A8S1KLK9_9CILI|nr:unnamed protein product [Paramecium sonneborni]